MGRVIKLAVIIGIVAVLLIANFELFFNIFETVAMVSFFPLLFAVIKSDK